MMTTKFRTYELAVELYRESAHVKAGGSIKNQLERASLSSVLNLFEGAAKPTKADKRRFYAIAYGSIREMQAIFRLLDNSVLYKKADALGAHAYQLMKATR